VLAAFLGLPEKIRAAVFGIAVVAVVATVWAASTSGGSTGAPAGPPAPPSAASENAAPLPSAQPLNPNGSASPPAEPIDTAAPTAEATGAPVDSERNRRRSDLASAVTLPLSRSAVIDAATAAIRFVEHTQTFRYDQDDRQWSASAASMVVTGAAVDPAQTLPTGSARAQMRREKYSIVAEAREIKVAYTAQNRVSLAVTVALTTAADGRDPRTSTVSYSVVMAKTGSEWLAAELFRND